MWKVIVNIDVMSEASAATQLSQAERLAAKARREARWYVRYLVAFGIASFGLACVFAFVGGLTAVAVTTPLWVLFVVGLSVWAARHPVTLRGYGGLHLAIMGSWGVIWLVTVFVGTSRFPYAWPWWFGAGLAMAAVALCGAGVALRRSRR